MHAQSIDYLINTHYHIDHVGGIPTLAAMIQVQHFYDHGAVVEPSTNFNDYVTTAGAKRITGKPGDKITLGDLLHHLRDRGRRGDRSASSHRSSESLVSGRRHQQDHERWGRESDEPRVRCDLRDLHLRRLGHLTWNIEQKLMCPTNRLGTTTDIYQVNHHGMDISNSPQLVHALAPTVAVMDNGPAKGGSPGSVRRHQGTPVSKDLWSLHHVPANDAQHNADDALTANLDGPDNANWIKAVIQPSGAYTVTNSRNATSRTYASK